MLKKTAILVLAILAVLPVIAARVEIDETRKTTSDGEVSVELLAGTVTVIGWDRDEVHITGTIDDRYEELEIDSERGEVSIEVDIDDGEHRNINRGADLTIHVPRASEIEIEVISGDVELSGALSHGARISVETVNGQVVIRLPSNTSAKFDISTFNGSIKNEFGPAAEKTSKYLPASELSFTLGSGDARVTVEAFNGTVRLISE